MERTVMDIDAASFATNIGQTAAAQVAALLWGEQDSPAAPILNWPAANAAAPAGWVQAEPDENLDDVLPAIEATLDRLGLYVCAKGVDKGEWLYRQAVEWGLVPNWGWAGMSFVQRQPWEAFVAVTLAQYRDLRAHQLALEETNRPRPASVATTLKREDSIFEELPGIGDLDPVHVESLRLSGAYRRGQEEQKQRDAQDDAMRAAAEAENAQFDADRVAFNGANPAAFDHDGDGRPGGSAPRNAVEKSIDRNRRRRAPKPAPLSVGEAPVKPPVNRGGRGKRKQT